ncbi:MAG: glutamate-5-semialdehyde dehydrogenase [Candidatus Omnitrophica bacterium]|nr:glutamate-5-semialdehyde dehydrogenase [Candidatus Omnitrophota bacterium]
MGSKAKKWESELLRMLGEIREASREVSRLSSSVKKKILLDVALALKKETRRILRENRKDLVNAREKNLSRAMIDRLTLNPKRIDAMVQCVRTVAGLSDPIGKVTSRWTRPNGLRISRVSVPIGVIFIVYESRPNVTAECASLCFKSGNVVILRGGREAYYSNQALVAVFEKVLTRYRLPKASVSFVRTLEHKAVDFLLKREKDIHLVIPRGGESLIRKVVKMSRIPVIKHYQGICHVYVDRKADLKKAVAIAYNAKMQRPGVCNAMETLLVHRDIAKDFLPVLGEKLREDGCEIRGDYWTRRILPWVRSAQAGDYGHEFLDKVLAIRVVPDLLSAIRHIQTFGSAHTDAIVTQDRRAAQIFTEQVDSSSVMVNASTRFSDGFEYGFGAEIGISTDKIHARGPMGLEGLTSYKYIVEGNGQIRT